MNRHTPKNYRNSAIDAALPKAAKIRIAPRKTAARKPKESEYRVENISHDVENVIRLIYETLLKISGKETFSYFE